MKSQLITVLLMLFLALSSNAQNKNTGKAIINTPGVHCENCQKRVESYLSRQYGITSVTVNLRRKTTTVTWIPDRTNLEEVKTHINNAGFDADNEQAEEDAYHRLPKACQIKQLKDSAVKLPQR